MESTEEKDLPAEVLDELNTMWSQWLRGEEVEVKQTPVSRNYKLHAVHALLQKFPMASVQTVQAAFDRSGSYRQALADLLNSKEKDELKSKRPKRKAPPVPKPRALDREMKLSSTCMTATVAFQQRQKKYEERVEQLKAVGGLGKCGCCNEDLSPEAELRCTAAEGHGFCIPCVKNGALAFFGNRLFTLNLRQNGASSSANETEAAAAPVDTSCTVLRCMQMGCSCEGHFSDVALRTALPVKEYVRYSRRSAALQAAGSGLKDLVACPACDFMVEMSDPHDSVVRCLDPECGKVTCRWCQEENHPGLRCDQVEKDGEVKIRTFLEEHMAETFLRRCPNPKCKKPYERIEGCNHIKCPCGTHSCYLCGKQVDKKRGYDHFKDGHVGGGKDNESSRCTVYNTPAWARPNSKEAQAEAEKALQEYLKDDPELQEIMEGKGKDVVKRTLSHISPSGSQTKRRRKSR